MAPSRWEEWKSAWKSLCSLRIIWQSPDIFHHAGMYLKVDNKRYRIYKSKRARA